MWQFVLCLTVLNEFLFNFLGHSLRTGVRTVRGRAPSPSTTLERSASAAWASPSCCTRTTWTCRPPAAPSPSAASPAWATTGGLWTAGAGRPPSWVGSEQPVSVAKNRFASPPPHNLPFLSFFCFGESEDCVCCTRLSAAELGQLINAGISSS